MTNSFFWRFLFYFCCSFTIVSANRTFEIDYNSNTFLKDGQPFSYVSGSIHLYRIPKDLWEDRLNRMWAAGLNAIQTYVFWNEHEQIQGTYDFEGQYNIFEFIEMAQKIGFLVILRPGPFVCAEHEFGGLPWWLLANGTDSIVPRTSEINFMNAVTTWFGYLLPKFKPYLYENGGPIISIQVENEYSAYYACDKKYTASLRDLFRKHLGNNVVLFTTNSYEPAFQFYCGVIDGVYSTIDFGIERDVDDAFNLQRKYSPKGPLVNSEFYPGWLDFWGFPHQKRDTKPVVDHLEKMFNRSANVNFYMFHGGTNFGFSNGANLPFLTEPTSYDYDAPISEAGDITDKYLKIRESVLLHQQDPSPVPIPLNSTKLALGKISITQNTPLFDSLSDTCKSSAILSEKPLSFEKLGQGYGVVMYTTRLSDPNVNGKVLSIPGIRDRAYIQIGNKFVGTVERVREKLTIESPNNEDTSLRILVENSGRLNFGYLLDAKGILSDVTLNGKILKNWSHCLTKEFFPYFQLKDKSISSLRELTKIKTKSKSDPADLKLPGIYTALIEPVANTSFDTFLRLDKFSKGIVLFDNGTVLTNLGRYWPAAGPQITLYVPGVFFSTTFKNFIHIVEFESSTCSTLDDCFIEFINYPIIG